MVIYSSHQRQPQNDFQNGDQEVYLYGKGPHIEFPSFQRVWLGLPPLVPLSRSTHSIHLPDK